MAILGYTTDRLGMPLIETVTYPDMKTPDEAAEAANYIRFLNRSTGKVRTGIGAARADVNVSIHGGTRVEIKGVSHISYIPRLVHNEAFRQKSLLEIRNDLIKQMPHFEGWKIGHVILKGDSITSVSSRIRDNLNIKQNLVAVNLPGFKDILSFFTQPGRMFSEEISDRLKVIACIDKPNMTHSEDFDIENSGIDFQYLRKLLNAKVKDAQILFWGLEGDISIALESIEERCRLAFVGVPNETRKSFANGTTMFERVLPGADRMYPDTDSAPISITQELIDLAGSNLPIDVASQITKLKIWDIPADAFPYILRYNLVPLIKRICDDFIAEPQFVGTLLAHKLKFLQGKFKLDLPFNFERIYQLFAFVKEQELERDLIYKMLPVVYENPKIEMADVLKRIYFSKCSRDSILSLIPIMHVKFIRLRTSGYKDAELCWIMKNLQEKAMGNIPLHELASIIRKGGSSS